MKIIFIILKVTVNNRKGFTLGMDNPKVSASKLETSSDGNAPGFGANVTDAGLFKIESVAYSP